MVYRSVSILSLALLAACGGSSTPVITPIAAAGFAADDLRVRGGETFTVQDATRIVGEGEQLSFARQDVTYAIRADGLQVTLTIDGEVYNLPFVGGRTYSFESGDDVVEVFRLGDSRDEAEIIEVFSVVDDNLNASNIVIGFDTDPEDVASQNGNAVMNGEIFATARNGFNDAFGSGNVRLNVDFDANTVDGNFNIRDLPSPNSDFAFPTSTYTLNRTSISGNGFNGTIRLASGDIGGTLRDATYSGRFFGVDAPSAGGQVRGRVDISGGGRDTLVEGAFLVTD